MVPVIAQASAIGGSFGDAAFGAGLGGASIYQAPAPSGPSDPLYAAAGSTPALDLNFEASGDLTDAISGSALGSFARSSAGTYLDSDGFIKSASAGIPRFEHDKDGNRLGFLFEDRATNYMKDSEDFSTTNWTLSGATLSTDAITAPDGTMTADKLIATGPAGLASNRVYQVAPFANPWALSIFAKAGEADEILFRTGGGTFSSSYIVFSLVDGSVVTQSGTTPTAVYAIEYPNGWWRFVTANSSMSTWYFAVYGTNCANGNGIYVWGANAAYGTYNWKIPTSYIKTTSSTVTRVEDTYNISGASFASYFNTGGPGTKYMDFNAHGIPSVPYAVREKNGNFYTLEFRNGYASVVYSAVQAQFDFSSYLYSDREKWTLAFDTNDFAASRNGGTALTDPFGTNPSAVVNSLYFEESVGIIRRYAYWPTRIENANLEAMTAP